MASSTPSTPHRASCRTADFREAVQRQRARLSLPTPASDILPRAKRKSAFTADSLSCLQEVSAMHAVLRESHAAYVLDEEFGGMAEAERDVVDAETQRCLKASNARIDALKQQAVAAAAEAIATGEQSEQLQAHYQAMVQLLLEQLQAVATLFDDHRSHRLQKAAEAREARLGAAAAAAAAQRRGGGGGGGGGEPAGAAAAAALAEIPAWDEGEVLSDEELDEQERAQMQLENETLQKELDCLAEQAREAESKVHEIASLSHLFATKVEQQADEIEMLHRQAEETAENLVRGNELLDSAAKHSRDFRLLVLSFLITASFALLFLDWYYD